MAILSSNNSIPPHIAELYGLDQPSPRTQSYQPPSSDQTFNNLFSLGVGVGALGYLGRKRVPFVPNPTTFNDLYVGIARGFEEYSPGRIFRTFNISSLLSPLETVSRQSRYFSPGLLTQYSATPVGQQWLSYIGQLTGAQQEDLLTKGFRFHKGQLLWGKTGRNVLLQHASVIRNPTGASATFMGAYRRSLAKQYATSFQFQDPTPFFNRLGERADDVFTFIGGQSRRQHYQRLAFGYGTSLIERFNRLIDMPFELPGISPLIEKLPFRLGVKPSSGLRTFGKLFAKWGLLAPAAVLGYQQLDYWTQKSELLDNTIFSEGITAAGGHLLTRAQLALSHVAEFTGLHNLRERQEEIAPRSTSFLGLMAIPATGALAGLTAGYLTRVGRQLSFQAQGLSAEMASLASNATENLFLDDIRGITRNMDATRLLNQQATDEAIAAASKMSEGYLGRAAKVINNLQNERSMLGRLARTIGDPLPHRIGAGLGVLGGLLAVSPFLLGSLVPEERPEELEALYSGEELVPIRRSRWWSFGRCLVKSTTCRIFDTNIYKRADEIKIGDILIGRDNKPAKVINISKRKIKEEVYSFYTSFDRDISTSLTGNHIVPVYRDGETLEIEAKNIRFNDFVEIPYKNLESNIDFLYPQKIIKDEKIWVTKDKVYSAQHNSHTNKLQKSGHKYIDKEIQLNYDIGWFFGIFAAEGNLSFDNGNPTIIETTHNINEKDIADKIIDIAKKYFHTNGSISYRIKKNGNALKVRLCSAILAKFIRWIFYLEEYKAENKSIPDYLYNTCVDFKKGFIDGYWAGDGHLDSGSKVYSSCRKGLLYFTQQIYLSLGLASGISFENNNKKGRYRLRVASTKKYHKRLCGSISLKIENGRLYSRIKEIKKEYYNDYVYDFEVEDKNHLFCAGTFLVHNSPLQGTSISGYAPHWYPRMLSRAKERIWGEDESPIERAFSSTFTYEQEREHMYDMPAPLSEPAFRSIPFIGPLLSATIGQLIKPQVPIRPEEWMREGGEVVGTPLGFGQYETGGEGEATPIAPTSIRATTGEQVQYLTDIVGLPGFIMESIKEGITGEEDWFGDIPQLESMGTDMRKGFWEKQLGDPLYTEAIRRLYPSYRNVPTYNPLENLMPSWLPSAGDLSEDFRTGNPYEKASMGYYNLPGGYELFHPELQGVDPEEWPDVYKYDVLMRVAPYSQKLKDVQARLRTQDLDQQEEELYQATKQRLREIKDSRTNFTPYQWKERDMTPSEIALARANEDSKSEDNIFTRKLGRYWEMLAHGAETPLEYLTPISPAKKLLHVRSAVEDYERTQVYGTQSAFWDRPYENFLRPFLTSAGEGIGFTDVPDHVEQKRNIEEYFDILHYVKATRLKNIAQREQDEESIEFFSRKQRETLTGIDPFTYNFSNIFRSLPRRERNYFNEFIQADATERQEILDMIPENEKSLYIARWKMKDVANWKKAIKKDVLTDEEEEQARKEIEMLYKMKETEGFPKTEELFEQYIKTRMEGESYEEWYRRRKILPEKLEDLGMRLPGPDWVGFSPSVSLEDVKMKVVQSIGGEPREYDIWGDQIREGKRKAYLDEAALTMLEPTNNMGPQELQHSIEQILSAHGVSNIRTVMKPVLDGPENLLDLDISEDRTEELRELIRKKGLFEE